MTANHYAPPNSPVVLPARVGTTRKVLVSILWILVLNFAFLWAYVSYNLNFNSRFTLLAAYEFGGTYAIYFFFSSIILVVLLAARGKLPGAKDIGLPPNTSLERTRER